MLYLCVHKVYLFAVVLALIIIGFKCPQLFSYKEHLNQCLLNCVYEMRILNQHGFTLSIKFNYVYMSYKPLACDGGSQETFSTVSLKGTIVTGP